MPNSGNGIQSRGRRPDPFARKQAKRPEQQLIRLIAELQVLKARVDAVRA